MNERLVSQAIRQAHANIDLNTKYLILTDLCVAIHKTGTVPDWTLNTLIGCKILLEKQFTPHELESTRQMREGAREFVVDKIVDMLTKPLGQIA